MTKQTKTRLQQFQEKLQKLLKDFPEFTLQVAHEIKIVGVPQNTKDTKQ